MVTICSLLEQDCHLLVDNLAGLPQFKIPLLAEVETEIRLGINFCLVMQLSKVTLFWLFFF